MIREVGEQLWSDAAMEALTYRNHNRQFLHRPNIQKLAQTSQALGIGAHPCSCRLGFHL